MPVTVEKIRRVHPEQEYKKPAPYKSWFKKPVVWALLIFVCLNLFLWQRLSDDKPAKDLWSGTGSIDLTVNDFKKLSKPPQVVLLGSSLMMFPFWSMDRELDPSVGDIFHHHGSRVLEAELRKNGFSDPSVFSFAIFGQMVSDAYIYVDEYLKGEHAPSILIYGIAPRDFCDNDLPNPMSTNTFKRLVNLSNFARYAGLYLPGFQDRIDFLCSHVCYFYNKRWRLQQESNKGLEKFYALTGLAKKTDKDKSGAKAGFMLFGSTQERWNGSKQEYARRYRNIDERDLSVQTGFLTKLLDTCKERKIKVILVNMPLSQANRSLFPPGFYDRFRRDIAALAKRDGVRLLDIGDSAQFNDLDFWDTAHLEQAGGHKIINNVMPLLNELAKEKASAK